MSTLTIEGWHKPSEDEKSKPMGSFHFHVSDESRLQLEQAEEQLQKGQESEIFLDVDMDTLELQTPAECGPLSGCQFRVYLDSNFHRGQFHLVGHRVSDGSQVYTNAVMIEHLW